MMPRGSIPPFAVLLVAADVLPARQKTTGTTPDTAPANGGTFQMGSTSGEPDERPLHLVTVSSFCLGKYEVSQKEWAAIKGSNPSNSKGDDKPVEQVSWLEAVDFCNRLSAK